ncbi:MAG: malate dehydrogenase (quinone) [Verrucomicrobiota bacterium]
MSHQIQEPDVILIGSGVMSANLGALLKKLSPDMKIQLYEVAEKFSMEASDGWHNAGTGHAGLCELSYTPDRGEDGEVEVQKAVEICHMFQHSKQFWSYAVKTGMIQTPSDFINPVPHLSFVYGQEQVDFLKSRYEQMSKHHFFDTMEYTEDREVIKEWAPLLLDGRDDTPIAVTKVNRGTDVNFGSLANLLIDWLNEQEGCSALASHKVIDLDRTSTGWTVTVKDLKSGQVFQNKAKFVFVGAGGGSLPLLQKSGISEAKGLGGFPIGGQWLVCDQPDIVEQHQAKVYGMSPGAAPTMAVPHLDTRIIDGKKSLLFGPYAAWTTKFLHEKGSLTDLPFSVRPDNVFSLMKVGFSNLDLVAYLAQQGLQSMEDRMSELRNFYPSARTEDWKLIDAGIRVQAIKKEDGDAGIVHFGTEVITDEDRTISALLGASPGASVCVNIVVEVIQKCFAHLLESEAGKSQMKEMIPTYDENLEPLDMANRQKSVSEIAEQALQIA